MSTAELHSRPSMPRRPAGLLPVAIVTVVLVTSIATEAPAQLPFRICLFRNIARIPCPGCGMTRGFVAMGHGQIGDAWRSNPLSPAAFVGAWAYLLYFSFCRLWPALRRMHLPNRVNHAIYGVLLAAVVGSWTVSLVRHFSHAPGG